MTRCLFASDLHGRTERYYKLWKAVEEAAPHAVFLGGDLMAPLGPRLGDFVNDLLVPGFERVRKQLGDSYPEIFLILGNDDGRFEEAAFLDAAATGLWTYAHNRICPLGGYRVLGYSYVPPTPFGLKDWERYDVSRYVPPGCVSPEDGWRGVPVADHEVRYSTIRRDLDDLAGDRPLQDTICLFHSPPHETSLDRAANDGKMVDYVPLDLHVGSIAIRRFIEKRQPLVTLHGHVHESANLTGSWRDRIGRTHLFGAAHDGDELALVRFSPEEPDKASRDLL